MMRSGGGGRWTGGWWKFVEVRMGKGFPKIRSLINNPVLDWLVWGCDLAELSERPGLLLLLLLELMDSRCGAL